MHVLTYLCYISMLNTAKEANIFTFFAFYSKRIKLKLAIVKVNLYNILYVYVNVSI